MNENSEELLSNLKFMLTTGNLIQLRKGQGTFEVIERLIEQNEKVVRYENELRGIIDLNHAMQSDWRTEDLLLHIVQSVSKTLEETEGDE